jgi:hypothetical protein
MPKRSLPPGRGHSEPRAMRSVYGENFALSLLKQSGESGEALDSAAAILRNLEAAGDQQSQGVLEALRWTHALTGVEVVASSADVEGLRKQLGAVLKLRLDGHLSAESTHDQSLARITPNRRVGGATGFRL